MSERGDRGGERVGVGVEMLEMRGKGNLSNKLFQNTT